MSDSEKPIQQAPAPAALSEPERAADEVAEKRRRGVHCHVETWDDASGHHAKVVDDPDQDN